MYRSNTLKSSTFLDSPQKSATRLRYETDSPLSSSRGGKNLRWQMEESQDQSLLARPQATQASRFKQEGSSKYDRLLAELTASNQDWTRSPHRMKYTQSTHTSKAKDKVAEVDLTASRVRDYSRRKENKLAVTLDAHTTLDSLLAKTKKTGGTPTFGENQEKDLFKSTKLTSSRQPASNFSSKQSSHTSSYQQTPKEMSPSKKMALTLDSFSSVSQHTPRATDRSITTGRNRSKSPLGRGRQKTSSRLGCLTTRDIADLTKSVSHKERSAPAAPPSKKSLGLEDFLLGKVLGEGAFGQVHFAIHRATGMAVAIKKIPKEKVRYMLEQFITEIKLQLFFSHPNIVSLYGFFCDSSHFYTVMEYLEGGSLFSLLKKKKRFSEEETAEQLKQVCLGLKQMHDHSVLHRDIKPENVVITNGVSKLCDLGWAAILKDRRNTYCGTLDYVSPEIIEGQAYDDSVDIWCIGVLAFEMITGKTPFYNISRAQTMDRIKAVDYHYPCEVGSRAKHFIDRILKRKPEERMGIDQVLADPFLKT